MGWVFFIFSYFGGAFSLVLAALALSAGLYLLAELAEEFPTKARRIIKYVMIFVNIMVVVLWVDGLPSKHCAGALVCHLAYYWMFQKFPFVELMSLPVLLSLVAFVYSNVMWLEYMLLNTQHDILQVLGFFVIVVWAVPLSLFICMSANENILPGLAESSSLDNGVESFVTKKNHNVVIKAFNWILIYLRESPYTFGVFSARDALHARRN